MSNIRVATLRLGLVEASQNKIGSPVDQILLYCFHYDATIGKYSASIMNIVRLGGVATMVAIAGFVFGLRRFGRERKDGNAGEYSNINDSAVARRLPVENCAEG